MINLSTDINDLILQRTLYDNTFGLNSAIERMSSGYKINHASDNAANFSIATDLSKKISSMLQIQNNTEDGIAMLQTAEGGLAEIQSLLEKLRDLSMRAANGSYDEQSRNSMQEEADAITEEIARIRNTMKYNGLSLYETPKEETTVVSKLAKAAQVKTVQTQAAPVTQNIQTNDNFISEAAGPALTRMASPAAISLAANVEGAEDFSRGQQKVINIDGVNYTIKNNLSAAQTLSYVKDSSTGELTFLASNFTITCQSDVEHNLIIDGQFNTVYGGDLNDKIYEQKIGAKSNTIYGGDGDDEIVLYGLSKAYGEGGNDTLEGNVNSSVPRLYGGEGDDIININNGGIYAYGGDGNDIINVKGSSAAVFGEAGDDTINILSGSNSIIDGGSGTNTVTGNINTNYVGNAIGANSYIVDFSDVGLNVSKVVNINGIDYTISKDNSSAPNSFVYQVADDGQINFNSSYYTIKGDVNKAHNVKITGISIVFHGSNLADKITVNKNNCSVYAYDGDDFISVTSTSAFIIAGDGDDTISVTSGGNVILGGAGNDTVTMKNASNSYFDGGDGDDNVTLTQSSNAVIVGGSGNNTLVDNGTNTFIHGFGDKDNAEAVNMASKETVTTTIDSKNYTISNSGSFEKTLLYKVNPVTGEIDFNGYHINITGQSDVSHNVNIYGKGIGFTGGEEDDIINLYNSWSTIYGQGGNDKISTPGNASGLVIYGGDGDDEIVSSSGSGSVYGDAGNDTITINGKVSTVNGGEGDDTYNINSSCTPSDLYGNNIYYINVDNVNVSGGNGDDTFYVNGNNNIIKGGGGNDYYVVNGENNALDGGTGDNHFVDNSTSTGESSNNFSNTTVDPNSGVIRFTVKNETASFVLNGKTYTATNNFAGANTLNYSLNLNTGVITINGSEITLDAQTNEQVIMNIRGDNNTINGSNLADRITIEQGSGNIVNGLGGNDTLIMDSENNSLIGGNGNDTITLNASTNMTIDGGVGNDILNINSSNNTNIIGGTGDDRITVSGKNNNINASDGNNNITINNSNNTVNAANGDNKFVITGSENTITAGSGNNSIGIHGNNNNITAQNAKGDINIIGNSNTVLNTRGENSVIIKGNGNNYSSIIGKKDITITGSNNEILTGAGNDTFTIKGNSNTVESTSGKNEFNVRGNDNTVQGGTDIDNIKLNGDNNTAKGGDASDTFMVSGGSGNNIDGEAGDRNTLIDNGKSTVFTNAVDITPRPFEAKVKVDIGSGKDKFVTTSISFNLFDFSLDFSTNESAREGLEKIDDMIKTVQEQILNIGTSINRLQTIAEAQALKIQNLISTRSTIQDADIAKESSSFIRYQILQQASATLMASSRNLKAENVLGLIQGLRN